MARVVKGDGQRYRIVDAGFLICGRLLLAVRGRAREKQWVLCGSFKNKQPRSRGRASDWRELKTEHKHRGNRKL
jgi:hypothetical protein